MFRAKWAWGALFLVLGSGSARAQEGAACEPAAAVEIAPAEIAPAVVLEQSMIVPAVLKWTPGESPLVLQFASAPPIIPGNRCEAQCLTELRQRERECRNAICPIPGELLLGVCVAGCASEI